MFNVYTNNKFLFHQLTAVFKGFRAGFKKKKFLLLLKKDNKIEQTFGNNEYLSKRIESFEI